MISAPYGEYLKGVTGDGNARSKCQWTHARSPKASHRASSRFVQMPPCEFVAMAMARERLEERDSPLDPNGSLSTVPGFAGCVWLVYLVSFTEITFSDRGHE